VTGSAHVLEIGDRRILLDCGLFDTDRMQPDSPNRSFTFDPQSIDAVIISHAHNDHIGRLPCLTKAGYRGPIYATPATADILNVMLRDSARIQREDARTAALRKVTDDPLSRPAVVEAPVEPLFELHDVEWVVEKLQRLGYDEPTEVVEGVTLTYRDAGHILGSAIVQLDYKEGGEKRRFVFTGDLGRRDMGLLPNPTVVKGINVLVSESTYGAKELDPYDKLIKQLHAIVARAARLQSKIVIPAFSLGRTQRMVYCFQELFSAHKVPPIPVYVDSPLALRLTEVHRDHPDAYTKFARRVMGRGEQLFDGDSIHFCATWDESRRLNYLSGPLIIIASSGMCEAGRIRHHLRHTVEDPDNAVVIVSYQAEGTLGRQISEGAEQIRIMDQWHDLNAAVYVLDGFSGHADRNDLLWWYEQTGGHIEKAFLVHGEPEAMESLAPGLQEHVTSPVVMPEPLESFEV
jgi:metallo-beta-lactamase family protein